MNSVEYQADVAIIGGGLGGISAALAALESGHRVVLTEPTRWLGGQLTSQLVPTDEHFFIEKTGANASYRRLRDGLRDYYRRNYPLTDAARNDPHLNPGAGWVSPISVEPRVAVAVIDEMLAPYRASGRLVVVMETEPIAASTDGDRVTGVRIRSMVDGSEHDLLAPYFVDATELGDLLPLAGVEFVSGRESRDQTGEPGAAEDADPTDMQGVTWCFIVDHLTGEDHTIDRPDSYDYFRSWCPPGRAGTPILDFVTARDERGASTRSYRFDVNPDDDPLTIDLDHRNHGGAPELWTYRRIAARRQFRSGFYRSDIIVVNWPQNDYTGGPLFGVPDAADHWRGAKDLSRALLYWLQTEAPRPDGGTGWPGLRPRPDLTGTSDGFAMAPYIRESRRIQAVRTIVEQDVSTTYRGDRGAGRYADTVGTGHYYWIDQHSSTGGRHGGGGTPHPFEIPLGALLPVRVRNLVPACKNIGTTQITNGCYRLHPVEWSIGEAAGSLLAYCLGNDVEPHQVAEKPTHLAEFQRGLEHRGVQLRWDPDLRWTSSTW